jgi:drug/metabolite transporter (DMT)-like permease
VPPELEIRHFASKVFLSFAALYTIWGSTYYAIQLAGKSVPPLLMAGTRFLVAGSILLAWCWVSGTIRRGDFNRRTWGAAGVVGLGLMLIGNGGVAIAVQRIPTGISAVIVALTPMWLVLFDWAQQRGRRPSNAVVLGIAFGVTGIATLKLADGGGEGQLDLIGILINIVATIGWAFGSIWGRTAARAASPVTACAMQMLAGGAILLVVSPFFESWSAVRIERTQRGVLALMGVPDRLRIALRLHRLHLASAACERCEGRDIRICQSGRRPADRHDPEWRALHGDPGACLRAHPRGRDGDHALPHHRRGESRRERGIRCRAVVADARARARASASAQRYDRNVVSSSMTARSAGLVCQTIPRMPPLASAT